MTDDALNLQIATLIEKKPEYKAWQLDGPYLDRKEEAEALLRELPEFIGGMRTARDVAILKRIDAYFKEKR